MRRLIEFLKRLVEYDRWFLYAVVTAPLAWLVAVGVGLPFILLAEPASLPERGVWSGLLSGLLLAPVIENLFMIAMIGVARSFFSVRVSIAIMVGVMAVIHALAASWMAIAATVGFLGFGVSYLIWSPSGGKRAYWITVLQHGIFNLPATLAATVLR